jgi:internalin A
MDSIIPTTSSNFKCLDLSHQKLDFLPDDILNYPNITEIDLSHNMIQTLPDAFSKLSSLKEVNLSNNSLTDIPEVLFQLKNLSILNLSHNKLNKIPIQIKFLENLITLDLSDNCITEFPREVCDVSNLISLDLSGNGLENINLNIKNLYNLKYLNLVVNDLTELPKEIGCLRNLRYLNCANNKIHQLPVELKDLYKLKTFLISENPLEYPPLEIIEKGFESIRNFLKQLSEHDIDYIYEAKLLIIGEGGAGKTSLANKVIDSTYILKDEDSTAGIDVIKWKFNNEDVKNFNVNIWDFGGQAIYHTTHQFFLTKRSLYILVADNRKEDTDFYYWLNIVKLLSNNSPLIIVQNEKKDIRRGINKKQLRQQYSNLKNIFRVNLKTNRGLDELISEIKHQLVNLDHIGSTLPKTWISVRNLLEKDLRNYISRTEYFEICENNGFTEDIDKIELSGYLHDLGVCLHFQDDEVLKSTVILKPKWATTAVYTLLKYDKIKDNFGKFNLMDVNIIWSNNIFSNKINELLRLIVNFKLCYEIPGKKNNYIAPQLLSDAQLSYDWDNDNNLIFKYNYDFLPKGIFPQIIVSMHNDIIDNYLVWKSGVVLEKNSAKAEIIEFYGKREITIRVCGEKFKKELMTVIVYQIDKINSSYKRLNVKKYIPCNCKSCKGSIAPHYFLLNHLRRNMHILRFPNNVTAETK